MFSHETRAVSEQSIPCLVRKHLPGTLHTRVHGPQEHPSPTEGNNPSAKKRSAEGPSLSLSVSLLGGRREKNTGSSYPPKSLYTHPEHSLRFLIYPHSAGTVRVLYLYSRHRTSSAIDRFPLISFLGCFSSLTPFTLLTPAAILRREFQEVKLLILK